MDALSAEHQVDARMLANSVALRIFELDELRAHLGERLVRYKIPRTFEFTTEPLRDDAGKLRRSALRAERVPG